MEKILLLSSAIGILFFIAKLSENHFVEKVQKPMKLLVRDSIIAMICSFIPLLLYFQFNNAINEMFHFEPDASSTTPAQIFTGDPGF